MTVSEFPSTHTFVSAARSGPSRWIRRAAALVAIALALAFATDQPARAAIWPESAEHWVNDYAGILAPAERESLDRRLREYEQRTANQIVVAIFPSLRGEDRDDLTNRLFRAWKIGQRARDNGVLLTVFVEDRKMRIEVGYGLEPVLTDAISSRILRERLAPAFREGRYADGLERAIASIEEKISDPTGTRAAAARREGRDGVMRSILVIALALLVLFVLFGGGNLLWALLGASITSDSRGWSRHTRRRGGMWTGGWGGGWGGFGGGRRGGWGGGGFSGGGGSSGGGGAGGSW